MLLFVNACARRGSRTKLLADALIKKLGGRAEEIRLSEVSFPEVDECFLEKRDALIAGGLFGDPMFDHARRFANADTIVIAAPYWDLSFPAKLKQFFEQINVLGITFDYSEEGYPIGLCKAKKLYYVTTAGGSFVPYDYGFGYVEALAKSFYGIEEVVLIKAEGLDIIGADTDLILNRALSEIENDV